ncbi:unnamed protein product [Closterium sp. NIES-54]
MRMAGAEYSTASYISHIVKGMPRGYNLMKRITMVPGTRESLDGDSITSYILQDEAMHEAEQPTELLPQANYAAPTKLNQQQGQRGKPSGSGSRSGRSTKDVDEKESTRDMGRGGGDRRRECWICHDPNHLSYECPDRDDSDEDDTKGARSRSNSRRPHRDARLRKEKQTSRKTSSTKDVDNSSGKSRGDGEASCSMVGVVEPTVSLAPEAGEDFQAVAAAVQANPMAVLLDSGCSHHLMGTKVVFVDMAPSDGVKHKPVLMLRSDRGGEFLGKEFTDFVDGKGIVHDLTCPYTPQQNGMAEREMRTAVESVRTMLLHMDVRHLWWHVALRQAVWVRNCLERSRTPPGTTPYQLLTGKKPDLTLAWVWGCMVQFLLVDDLAVDEEGELSAKEESTDSDVVEVPIPKPELRRTGRTRRPPERLSFHTCLPPAAFTTVYDKVDDDLLYDDAKEDEKLPELEPDVHADLEHRWDIDTMIVKEALASWKGEAVRAAMEEEIRGLTGMGTWELVEHLRRVNIMKNRWVLTTKYCIDDTVEREKARLVVKGFTQVCGANYDETYSPVSSYVTLRIFLSIVAVLDLNLMQLDMKNAFLQSKLDRVLYMYQSDCFDDGTSRVCKLLKSLYGLKQSPLLWYRALDGVLLGAGWKKSQVDEALYFKASDDGVTWWVLVYVDDLLAASSSPVMLKELKGLLEAAFELCEISPVVKYLGLEIVRDRPARKLWLHQQGYANKLSDQHWHEVDRCLSYLANTRDTALEFGGGPESLELIGYVDADDAGDKQNRTSTGGYVFVYGGAAVSWSSSRIKCVTLSSTELEYVAATYAGKEGRRLRFLLAEFKLLDAGKPTILRVDNKSAITVAEGSGLMGNLKHVERRYACLQHMVRRGKFVLKYILTTEQPADFLTKALHFPAFNRCSVAIGQVYLDDVGDVDDDAQQ